MSAPTTRRVPEILRPGTDGYDTATTGFYRAGRPALVARPRDLDEVATVLTRAAFRDMPVAVRSGGHGPLDLGTDTDALLIDLAHLDDVEVLDTTRRLVRVGGGATWGAVAAALDPYGWGVTAGDTAGVGVGGLTLGGGIGWLVRRDGLAIDNLVGARVVTADGQLLRASRHENPDLFWALRGGGGNFGVVVDFDFLAQPVGSVLFGTVTYRTDDPAALLGRWRDVMRVAPDELSSTLALLPRTPGAPLTATLVLCYAGTAAPDTAVEALLAVGTPIDTTISERRYADILEDAVPPPGIRLAVRNVLVSSLDDAVVAAITRVPAGPVPTAVAMRSLGGAFGRVPADATAFAHRDAEAMAVGLLMLPDTASDADVERALDPWREVAAHAAGTYLNFQGSATAGDLAAAYPPATYARLASVKRAHDPRNRFVLNHNVAPSRPGGSGTGDRAPAAGAARRRSSGPQAEPATSEVRP